MDDYKKYRVRVCSTGLVPVVSVIYLCFDFYYEEEKNAIYARPNQIIYHAIHPCNLLASIPTPPCIRIGRDVFLLGFAVDELVPIQEICKVA